MKIISYSILVTLLVTAIGCNETNSVPAKNESFSEKEDSNSNDNECFEVSYVTGICGQAVLKIKDPAFFKFGENWNGNTNVFYTIFDCSVDEAKLRNANFFVTISENNHTINCARCFAALDYQGSKKHAVAIVSECGDN
jgi:hypothetical protein